MPKPDQPTPARTPPLRDSLMSVSIMLLGLALLGGILFYPCRQVQSRMDAVTGSVERQTRWPCGITTSPAVEASFLETRLKTMGVPWTRDWRPIIENDVSMVGRASAEVVADRRRFTQCEVFRPRCSDR